MPASFSRCIGSEWGAAVGDIGTDRSKGPKVSLMNPHGSRALPKKCRSRIRAVIRDVQLANEKRAHNRTVCGKIGFRAAQLDGRVVVDATTSVRPGLGKAAWAPGSTGTDGLYCLETTDQPRSGTAPRAGEGRSGSACRHGRSWSGSSGQRRVPGHRRERSPQDRREGATCGSEYHRATDRARSIQ